MKISPKKTLFSTKFTYLGLFCTFNSLRYFPGFVFAKKVRKNLIVDKHPNNMSASEISNFIRTASQKEIYDKALWDCISRRCFFLIHSMNSKNLSYIFNGFARISYRHEELFNAFIERALDIIKSFEERDIALFLNALAKMKIKHEVFLQNISQLLLDTKFFNFTEKHISLIVNGFSKLDFYDEKCFNKFSLIIQNINIENMSSQGISNILNGFAHFRNKDEKLLAYACKCIKRNHLHFNSQNIANCLNAFSLFNYFELETLNILSKLINKNIENFSPMELAVTLNGLQKLNFKSRKTGECLYLKVEENFEKFSIRELSLVVHSFSKMAYINADGVCMKAFKKVKNEINNIDDVQTSIIFFHSFAKLKIFDTEFLKKFEENILPKINCIDHLSLASLLYSYGRIGIKSAFTLKVYAEVLLRTQEFTEQQFSNLLYASSKLIYKPLINAIEMNDNDSIANNAFPVEVNVTTKHVNDNSDSSEKSSKCENSDNKCKDLSVDPKIDDDALYKYNEKKNMIVDDVFYLQLEKQNLKLTENAPACSINNENNTSLKKYDNQLGFLRIEKKKLCNDLKCNSDIETKFLEYIIDGILNISKKHMEPLHISNILHSLCKLEKKHVKKFSQLVKKLNIATICNIDKFSIQLLCSACESFSKLKYYDIDLFSSIANKCTCTDTKLTTTMIMQLFLSFASLNHKNFNNFFSFLLNNFEEFFPNFSVDQIFHFTVMLYFIYNVKEKNHEYFGVVSSFITEKKIFKRLENKIFESLDTMNISMLFAFGDILKKLNVLELISPFDLFFENKCVHTYYLLKIFSSFIPSNSNEEFYYNDFTNIETENIERYYSCIEHYFDHHKFFTNFMDEKKRHLNMKTLHDSNTFVDSKNNSQGMQNYFSEQEHNIIIEEQQAELEVRNAYMKNEGLTTRSSSNSDGNENGIFNRTEIDNILFLNIHKLFFFWDKILYNLHPYFYVSNENHAEAQKNWNNSIYSLSDSFEHSLFNKNNFSSTNIDVMKQLKSNKRFLASDFVLSEIMVWLHNNKNEDRTIFSTKLYNLFIKYGELKNNVKLISTHALIDKIHFYFSKEIKKLSQESDAKFNYNLVCKAIHAAALYAKNENTDLYEFLIDKLYFHCLDKEKSKKAKISTQNLVILLKGISDSQITLNNSYLQKLQEIVDHGALQILNDVTLSGVACNYMNRMKILTSVTFNLSLETYINSIDGMIDKYTQNFKLLIGDQNDENLIVKSDICVNYNVLTSNMNKKIINTIESISRQFSSLFPYYVCTLENISNWSFFNFRLFCLFEDTKGLEKPQNYDNCAKNYFGNNDSTVTPKNFSNINESSMILCAAFINKFYFFMYLVSSTYFSSLDDSSSSFLASPLFLSCLSAQQNDLFIINFDLYNKIINFLITIQMKKNELTENFFNFLCFYFERNIQTLSLDCISTTLSNFSFLLLKKFSVFLNNSSSSNSIMPSSSLDFAYPFSTSFDFSTYIHFLNKRFTQNSLNVEDSIITESNLHHSSDYKCKMNAKIFIYPSVLKSFYRCIKHTCLYTTKCNFSQLINFSFSACVFIALSSSKNVNLAHSSNNIPFEKSSKVLLRENNNEDNSNELLLDDIQGQKSKSHETIGEDEEKEKIENHAEILNLIVNNLNQVSLSQKRFIAVSQKEILKQLNFISSFVRYECPEIYQNLRSPAQNFLNSL